MSATARKIRVMVVDDSAVIRMLITEALSADPEIEVVGTAMDPYIARNKMKDLAPDVLTLDIEMPRMDGLTFLQLIMEHRPMPVIIMSSLTQRGSQTALEALRLGAVEVLGKPADAAALEAIGPQLIEKVKAAAVAKLKKRPATTPPPPEKPSTRTPFSAKPAPPPPPLPVAPRPPPLSLPPGTARDPRALILLGASTGGTEALTDILTQLPAGLPPIAIVQHIPPHFSQAFAERLNKICRFEVREAKDGDWLQHGLALIAPGNFHMLLQRIGDRYRVRVTDGPMVWHQRPSVDMLFKSAAEFAGPHFLAGILTGMGKDGAEGLLRLRGKGAITFAQDEATSIVYGMPRTAWENGAAQRQLPLEKIAEYVIRTISCPPPAATSPSANAPALDPA
jgi:two-component system, chemotaxis family, protein-glutamate methylesterase/glutaminase